MLLLIIIALLIVGFCVAILPSMAKEDCKLEISASNTLFEGDAVTIKLTSANGTVIANETIKVTLNSNNQTTNEYNVTTNSKGIATLTITGVNAGNYNLICSFDGNNVYKSNETSKSVTIEEGVVETISQNQSSSTNSIDANRPRNDANYKGYTPYHESETTASGWDPSEHETYRENNPDGTHTIHYDDGYFRIVDSNGYVITYGFGG